MEDSDELDAIRERKRQELVDRAAGAGARAEAGARATDQADGATPTEPVYVETEADLESLIAAHRVVLADFYADWCGPCQLLEPTVRELARDTVAAVAKVDVDALPRLARAMQVRGVPTLVLYIDGEPAERLVGVQDYGTLERLIRQVA